MNVHLWLTTITGFAVPIAMLFYARKQHDAFIYMTLAAFAIFMGTTGMGKILPFFGHQVVGGSLYFPTALVAMSMAGYYIHNEYILRRMSRALLLGCLFIVIGASRWLVFAIYGEGYTTHTYEENHSLVLTSTVMVFKMYLAVMIGIAMSRWRPNTEAFLVVPAIVEIIATVSLPVYAAMRLNPHIPMEQWDEIALWTLLVRLSFVVIVGALIYAFPRSKDYAEGTDRRSQPSPGRKQDRRR